VKDNSIVDIAVVTAAAANFAAIAADEAGLLDSMERNDCNDCLT